LLDKKEKDMLSVTLKVRLSLMLKPQLEFLVVPLIKV